MGLFGSSPLHSVPILGPMLFDDPNEAKVQQALERMKRAYAEYRPQVEQGHMNALNQELGAYSGANEQLKHMYGPQAGVDLQALGQNQLHPGGAAPPTGAPPQTPQNTVYGPAPRTGAPGGFVGDTWAPGPVGPRAKPPTPNYR